MENFLTCPYLEERHFCDTGQKGFDATDDCVKFFCIEKEEYVSDCPNTCQYKIHADCGGHYSSSQPKGCFLCGSTSNLIVIVNRDEFINKNVIKVYVQDEIEEYDVCPECLFYCKKDVEEIIAFQCVGQFMADRMAEHVWREGGD